jgi:predicted PurR-regulated permease PerM
LALAFFADFFADFLADFFGADFFADFLVDFLADFLAFFADFLADFFEDFFADFFFAVTVFLAFLAFLLFLLFFALAIVNLLLPPINAYQAFQVVRFRTGPIDSVQSWPGTACRPIEKLNRVHHRN